MRRSKSVINDNNDNNNNNNQYQLENNEEQNQTNKITAIDINRIYGKTANSRKLKKIEDELDQFDPDSLMLRVDPTIHSTKTIKQIQFYYNNIKSEINKYISQEKLEESLKKKINKIPKQIELLVHPPKVSVIPPNDNNNKNDNSNAIDNATNSKKKNQGDEQGTNDKDIQKENKPVIDYHYKLKNLETEIEHSYHKYNTIKSKNNKLLIQLEEMRKENIFYMNKLSELKKELKEKEKHYNETKSKVEENINKNNQNDSLTDIIEKQAMLNRKTQEMTTNILDSNSEYIEKMAKNKYLDFQKKELEELIKNLEKKRNKEEQDFNDKIIDEYNRIKDLQKESKILKELDKDKMDKLEELFNEILEETKTQNSIQLIEHLSRTREENICFKSSVDTLYEYVEKLQEEVNALEEIISFCEEKMKNKIKLGENDIKNVDDINKASTLYIKLQYHVIKVLYKQYTDKLFEILKQNNIDLEQKYLFKSENINAFIEFTVDLQEKLKRIADKMKVEAGGSNSKSYFDFNKWNNKWDRINMAKDEVIKEYYNTFGKGLKFNKKSIKSLVDGYLSKDRKTPSNKK